MECALVYLLANSLFGVHFRTSIKDMSVCEPGQRHIGTLSRKGEMVVDYNARADGVAMRSFKRHKPSLHGWKY